MNKKIGCVVVLFNPNLPLLERVLKSVKEQVNHIFISDNSSYIAKASLVSDNDDITYHNMLGNVGIAAAQNVGIQYFREKEFTHVIFLDQDSIMNEGLVAQLLSDLDCLEKMGILVGAIGPRPYNRKSEKEYRGSVMKGKQILPNITEVTEIISSAALVPIKNFSDVGLLDESLFIDGVDHEWCWRGKQKKKLRFFIAERALLSHQLGEGDKHFILRKVAIPTAFRVYYQYRNYFILVRRKYVPNYWKLANGFKYFIKAFYYPLALEGGMAYFKNILYGIKDGILNNIKK